jgi:hypothetical protein
MRPDLEVADVFRRHGADYRRDHERHIGRVERRVMAAVEACRTVALGGHAEHCTDCGLVRQAYNSCLMGRIRNGELAFSGPDNLTNSRRFRRHRGCALLSITGVSRDRCYRRLL